MRIMGVEPWAIAAVTLATMLAAAASFTLKKGAMESNFTRGSRRISPYVFLAVALYLLSNAFFLVGLLGGPLSTLVPLTAIEYVWVVILARRYLKEEITGGKAVGIAMIAAGVMLVGLGS